MVKYHKSIDFEGSVPKLTIWLDTINNILYLIATNASSRGYRHDLYEFDLKNTKNYTINKNIMQDDRKKIRKMIMISN